MGQRKTTLTLKHTDGTLQSRQININSGIFQGDSLSPLLVCIALTPLSSLLNNSKYGYTTGSSTSTHIFYMDDLKTYAKNDQEQTGLLTIVKGLSDDTKMEFGLDKSAKATFKKGKLTTTENIKIDQDTTIQYLDKEGTYKYPGRNEGDGIQHAKMKEKLKKEYYRKIRVVTKSELNSINRMEAINILAIAVVAYSFNIIHWKLEGIRKLDRKTKTKLIVERMHHPKSDVDRVHLSRNEGDRNLIQLETACKTTTIGLDTYLNTKNDSFLIIVRNHQKQKRKYSVTSQAEIFRRGLNLPDTLQFENEAPTTHAWKVEEKTERHAQDQIKQRWVEKQMPPPSSSSSSSSSYNSYYYYYY